MNEGEEEHRVDLLQFFLSHSLIMRKSSQIKGSEGSILRCLHLRIERNMEPPPL